MIHQDDWQTGKSLIEANSHMLRNEVACDVIFLVGDSKDEVPAHKFVVMSRSPVLLRALIEHTDNPEVSVNVPEVGVDTFRDVLTWVLSSHLVY